MKLRLISRKEFEVLLLRSRSQVVIVLISLSFGLWFITPQNVWPASTEWLRYGDMEFAQYMWEYFRRTSILQWPIAEVGSFGEGWGTIFPSTGGIVLLGLPFKVMSPLLPESFQYVGLWTLANFGLQGYFAERVFFRLGLQEFERILGAVSILIAPIFIFRIGMTHLDLSAHWLILASFAIYLKESKPRAFNKLLLITVLALMINIYLFVIVFMISLAAFVKQYFAQNHLIRRHCTLIQQVLTLLTVSVLVWWLIGYYTFAGSARGVGFFRINALAFLNHRYLPSASFSQSLDNVPFLTGRTFFAYEGEGFGYLGLVGILGIAAILATLPKWWTRRNWLLFAPLTGISAFLLFVALSDRIALARREIQLPIPQLLIDARQVFRVANRFSWVAYYLLLVLGWFAVCYISRRTRLSIVALPLILSFGIFDQSVGMTSSRSIILNERRQLTLQSAEWAVIGKSTTKMYLVPTFDVQTDANENPPSVEEWMTNSRWSDLIAFGAEHQLVTNFAYVGRPVTKQVESANSQLSEMLEQGRIPRDSILFFALESDWLAARKGVQPGDISKQLDGYFIIVTNA